MYLTTSSCVSNAFRDFSLVPCRPPAAPYPSWAALPCSEGHSTLNPARFYYWRLLSCSGNLRNQLVCHHVTCLTFILKQLMSVGEKLNSVILHSQFGHNIYNIQSWITDTSRGKKVFSLWSLTTRAKCPAYFLCTLTTFGFKIKQWLSNKSSALFFLSEVFLVIQVFPVRLRDQNVNSIQWLVLVLPSGFTCVCFKV